MNFNNEISPAKSVANRKERAGFYCTPVDNSKAGNFVMEKWKDIPDYEGIYQASTHGKIRSLNRKFIRNGYPVNLKGKEINLSVHESGYNRINLSKNRKSKSHYVHRLITHTFLGKRPEGHDVDHINSIRTDNSIKNLRYLDIKSNRGICGNNHGYKGSKCHLSKLSESDVINIRSLKGVLNKEIAKMYNISERNVLSIIKRETWKHI